MKKFIMILLAISLLFTATACGTDQKKEPTPNPSISPDSVDPDRTDSTLPENSSRPDDKEQEIPGNTVIPELIPSENPTVSPKL